MSLDNDLRNLLNAEADRYEPPARISSRLLRRARVQRLGAAAGTVLGAAAILVAAVALAGSLVGTGTKANRPNVPADEPSPGEVLEHPDGHAAYVVATGTNRGADWKLLAHEDESGLCIDVTHGQEGGGGCGEWKPNRLSMTIDSGDGNEPISIQGAVGPQVESLEVYYVETEGTPTVETILGIEDFYEAPRQISLPARFFIVFLPPGATVESVSALDASGQIVDEQAELHRDLGDANPQTGPQEQIAAGRAEGMEWDLVARPHVEGPCFEFFLGSGGSQGGGGSCVSIVDGPDRLALAQTSFEGRPTIAPAFGVAPAETIEVTLELGDGSTIPGELFDAPDRFGKVKFFLLFPPNADTKGTVVASDSSGEILQRGRLCIAGAELGSSC